MDKKNQKWRMWKKNRRQTRGEAGFTDRIRGGPRRERWKPQDALGKELPTQEAAREQNLIKALQ